MRLSKKLVIAALGSATLVINSLAAFAARPTIEETHGTTRSTTVTPLRIQPTVEPSSLWDLSSSVRVC